MSSYLRILPNLLTGSRLFFAAGFLVLLAITNHEAVVDARRLPGEVWKLNWSFILFVIAGVTDVLDGPLARMLQVTSRFGRSFDPLTDKVLTGGGFVLLAILGADLTGVNWLVVAVILAREAFVTVIRGLSEYQGKEFGATWAGKLKMFLQSFAIGTAIMYMAHFQDEKWALCLRDASVWVAVAVTAFSAFIYLPRMKHVRFRFRRD